MEKLFKLKEHGTNVKTEIIAGITTFLAMAYILAVNPFNQPGVESYKKNMFALLGKPGYEAAKAELEARLK